MKQKLLVGLLVLCLFCGCESEPKLFSSLAAEKTGITFINQLTETEEININEYLYAHNGGGVAIGDINNDGLPDIYFTANRLPNRLYLNKGDMIFEDITEQAGVAGLYGPDHWTTGVVMADVNGDGWLDIYVSQVSQYNFFKGHNQLFINNGAQPDRQITFTEKAQEYGLAIKGYAQQAAFFDYDGDGDLDMYQLRHAVHNPDVYIKAVLRTRRDSLAGDQLFKNENGKFQDVSEEAGIYGAALGYGLAVAIGDLDNNGCPDIYVSNDFHENDYVYYNNCDGTFREDIKGTLGHSSTFSMGSDIADFNNDGLLDILTLDMKPEDEVIKKKSAGPDPYDIYAYKLGFGYYYQYPRNMLHLNRGNLFEGNVQFSEIGQLAGVDATDWSWSALMADLDNDGWKDIYITNGILRRPIDLDYINYTYDQEAGQKQSALEKAHSMPEGAVSNYAYQNQGNLTFKNVSADWGLNEVGYSMGAAYADLDNDGDLDLVVNHLNAPAAVYRNNSGQISENHFIKIRLKGDQQNPYGVGARVIVKIEEMEMIQELQPVRGWQSSVDYTLNFGLGKASAIQKIAILWPDGSQQVLLDVPADQFLEVEKKPASQKVARSSVPKMFSDITEETGITFKHQENHFIDFNMERLIPHKLSTEGPGLAVADVNGDGLEDFFIGGASGQAGELYLQSPQDSVLFVKSSTSVFEQDQVHEDITSLFFDADQDGDADLYMVSGGGQFNQSKNNEDRLYLNDGLGNFVRSEQSLPNDNGSCVVATDFDGDGYTDLFVGTRAVVGAYGLSPDSYLLWNNGQGQLIQDTTAYAQVLAQLGMVSDAVWLEDSRELAVVGEWMPITFLSFGKDNIEKREIPNTSGWWNTIEAADLNADGKLDLLCGNMGLNSELKASPQEPLGLYVKDFDNNLMTDPIMTYYRQGKEWVYAGLDALKKQIPPIRIRYNDYASFASHTFEQVFSEAFISNSVTKKVQMLQSVYLLNQGNGAYMIHNFPTSVQYAPLYAFLTEDFNQDGIADVLAVGNFDGNVPTLGRYDASYGSYLQGKGDGNFEAIEAWNSGFAVYGEARDMKQIKIGVQRKVIISRNNAKPRLMQVQPLIEDNQTVLLLP
ncbi:VCBS repeat-containing protein [Catalinimonas niigatensis]|uniref:VCBS repeat-containing protein n=1 Tax=Catalinimonas niigatensis TaxID=1397264 RepID=UPI0026657F6D|nr:VCBS repeat-containing protein [Catalinimonas niigatensis]WPP51668.1 VCBS repeat-containing protein [Catalinimonas niigatensis]